MKRTLFLLPLLLCGCGRQLPPETIAVIGGADGPTAIFVTGHSIEGWFLIPVLVGLFLIFWRKRKK